MTSEPEAEVGSREEAEGFHVEAIAGSSHVLCGVRGSVRVLFRIQTPANNAAAMALQRPPLRVACVLDNSGSMSGQKLEYAKRAVMKLVKHLDTRDELHFVTYNSTAKVEFQNGDLSEAGKEALRHQVDAVRARGGTNLLAGLESAVALLGATAETGSVSHCKDTKESAQDETLRRVFLFSDGCVTAGVTNHEQILAAVRAWSGAGVTTTSFGIGADFDETLMRRIAEEGRGRYAFLATAQDIPKLVSKAVHELLDLYASDAVLEVRGQAHTIVSRIYGAGTDDVDITADNSNDHCSVAAPLATPGLISLGDLHHDNIRQVLAELEVAPPGNTEGNMAFSAVEWVLTFQREGSPAQFSGQVELHPTRDRSLLGEEVIAVQTAFAIQRSADLDLRVAGLLARRERDQARDTKAQQLGVLQATLKAARDAGDQTNADVLARVLERAERVAEQLRDLEEDGDSSVIRRHCVHEVGLNRAMSHAGWASGCDSDAEGCDVANLDDLRDFSPSDLDSPVHSSPPSYQCSPPGSPRPVEHPPPSSRSRSPLPQRHLPAGSHRDSPGIFSQMVRSMCSTLVSNRRSRGSNLSHEQR